VREVLARAATPKSPEVNYGLRVNLNADRAGGGTPLTIKPHSLAGICFLTLFIRSRSFSVSGVSHCKVTSAPASKAPASWVSAGGCLGYFGPDVLFPFIASDLSVHSWLASQALLHPSLPAVVIGAQVPIITAS